MSEWTTVEYKKPKGPNQKKADPSVEQPKYYADEDVVVFRKNKPGTSTVINNTKPNTGGNNISNAKFHKLDNSTSAEAIKKVSLSTAQLLNKALVDKKWTQKDLVANIGGRAGVNMQDVQKIARGEAIANDAKLTAIENTLNVRLRGKFAGEPIRKTNK